MRKLAPAIALASAALLCSADLRADDGLRLSLSLSAAPAASALASGAPMGDIARAPQVRASIRDYRIGAEDLLDVQVFGVDQLSRTVRVNSRGQVSLPLIGVIDVAGLSAQEAEASITRRLGESYLQNPQVSLFIKEYTTQRVTIEGAVQRPGIYPLRGPTTLLTSLAIAGGQAPMS